MKTTTLHSLAIAIVFSISCYAQHGENLVASAKFESMPSISDSFSEGRPDSMEGDDRIVVAYHVEERINSKFGSQITTYNVSDVNLISKNDLGPNNTRTITPIYGKNTVKTKPETEAIAGTATSNVVKMNMEAPKAAIDIRMNAVMPVAKEAPAPVVEVKSDPVPAKTGSVYVNIDIISTYERILEKGYKSLDMLKRVANARFFEGNLTISAKWYKELFAVTTDLEPVYYYRYAESLKSIKEIAKANEMMAIFEKRTL